MGRIHVLQGRRRHDRRSGQCLDASPAQGHLAAVRDRRVNRRHPASRRRIYSARRPDAGPGQRGARSRRRDLSQNTVVAIEHISGQWLVKTDKGDIFCEHVISASGNFARGTGTMVGLDVPVIPVEHQYIVTEPHPAIVHRRRRGLPELGVLRESDSSWYMREENGGLLLGPYEAGAPCCYVNGPSEDSEYELFQEDLDRLTPYIETAMTRVPAFGEVGIKKVYNGAIPYTPDGSPIIGPAWGLPNFWLNEGHSFGVTAAGGAGGRPPPALPPPPPPPPLFA